MKPFSAFYYIKQNKLRAGLIIFMYILTVSIYLAGLYISNIEGIFDNSIDKLKNFAILMPRASDEGNVEFERAVEMLKDNEKVTLLRQGYGNIYTKSIMGFNIGVMQYCFLSEEDFSVFCEFEGISLTKAEGKSNLEDGSVIMSELQANNRGMKLGGQLKIIESDEALYGDFHLNAITDEEGYCIYYINDMEADRYMILSTGMTESEFRKFLTELKSEYHVFVGDREQYKEFIMSQIGSFHYIYFMVIVLTAITMAVTVNTAFAGMYQRRQGEFALYKAIGIPRRKIKIKIVSEVVVMDIIGIVIGMSILMLGIWLFNNLYLFEHGYHLFYYNKMALQGIVISNVIVLVPVILLQGRRLMKMDICDY